MQHCWQNIFSAHEKSKSLLGVCLRQVAEFLQELRAILEKSSKHVHFCPLHSQKRSKRSEDCCNRLSNLVLQHPGAASLGKFVTPWAKIVKYVTHMQWISKIQILRTLHFAFYLTWWGFRVLKHHFGTELGPLPLWATQFYPSLSTLSFTSLLQKSCILLSLNWHYTHPEGNKLFLSYCFKLNQTDRLFASFVTRTFFNFFFFLCSSLFAKELIRSQGNKRVGVPAE